MTLTQEEEDEDEIAAVAEIATHYHHDVVHFGKRKSKYKRRSKNRCIKKRSKRSRKTRHKRRK